MRWKLLIAISCNVNELEKHIIIAPDIRCIYNLVCMFEKDFAKNLDKIYIKCSTRFSILSSRLFSDTLLDRFVNK